MIDAVDRLLSGGLSAAALARARNKALSDHYFAVQSLERRVELCTFLDRFDAPDRLDCQPQRYLAPDADDLAAFLTRLRQAPRATLALVPRAEAA